MHDGATFDNHFTFWFPFECIISLCCHSDSTFYNIKFGGPIKSRFQVIYFFRRLKNMNINIIHHYKFEGILYIIYQLYKQKLYIFCKIQNNIQLKIRSPKNSESMLYHALAVRRRCRPLRAATRRFFDQGFPQGNQPQSWDRTHCVRWRTLKHVFCGRTFLAAPGIRDGGWSGLARAFPSVYRQCQGLQPSGVCSQLQSPPIDPRGPGCGSPRASRSRPPTCGRSQPTRTPVRGAYRGTKIYLTTSIHFYMNFFIRFSYFFFFLFFNRNISFGVTRHLKMTI